MIYYSEFERIKSIEHLFEKLAYFSVGLDFLVAIATFLVMQEHFSNIMLIIADYLMFFEVIIAGLILIILVVLKHYRLLLDNLTEKTFKNKYSKNVLTKTFAKFITFIFQLV
ncbi:MAG: hypothetical protein ACP5UN_02565 [Candidatus Micrarchaeia archaeon]